MSRISIPKNCSPDVRMAIQNIAAELSEKSSPEFATFTLMDLTASRLIATDANKKLVSSDLASRVAGTTNQITVTDDSDGTITLSTPQNIHTGASPTFADLTLSSPSSIYSLSHDSFADFVAGEHFLQTAITNVSTALATGILKVTTSTGALSSVVGKGGTVSFNDGDAQAHVVTIDSGVITSWTIDTVEQLT